MHPCVVQKLTVTCFSSGLSFFDTSTFAGCSVDATVNFDFNLVQCFMLQMVCKVQQCMNDYRVIVMHFFDFMIFQVAPSMHCCKPACQWLESNEYVVFNWI
jgi:hypothetical protein